jgi:hypothetical protein
VRARRGLSGGDERVARQRLQAAVLAEHLALAVALGSGLLLMQALGLHLGQLRWLDLKLGLVVFLVVPLEGMHAWVNHTWIARGLREPASARDLERGIAMDDMLRTLSAVLLGIGLPLLVWLSVRRPF